MPEGENKMVTDYSKLPSNTKKDKEEHVEERESLAPIVDIPAVRRKKTLGRKFKDAVSGEDARSTMSYVFFDVILPAGKNMFMDAVNEGLSRMLYGDVRGRTRPVIGGSSNNYVPYNRISSNNAPSGGGSSVTRSMTPRGRATHDFDELLLGSRGEAEMVLDALRERIARFEVATVSDLYDLVGVTGSFTDNKYGWYNLAGSTIDRAGREGYLLTLPKPELLN